MSTSSHHRDQGILGYQFMIANTQSGPYSWWESVQAPDPASPWIGSHPAAGAGASPHGWGAADANLVLLDSLIAERGDGSLIIGREVPNPWVSDDNPIALANVPITGGHRMGMNITTNGARVTLTLSGSSPARPVLFQLPAFVHNIASSSAGAIDEATGTVTLPATARTVTVTMTHRPPDAGLPACAAPAPRGPARTSTQTGRFCTAAECRVDVDACGCREPHPMRR